MACVAEPLCGTRLPYLAGVGYRLVCVGNHVHDQQQGSAEQNMFPYTCGIAHYTKQTSQNFVRSNCGVGALKSGRLNMVDN